MTIEHLRRTMTRDLAALRAELRAYPRPEHLWELPPGIRNSAGTLALHVSGNLQHFIGAQLGGTGYVRDRPAEFSERNVPLDELEERLDRSIRVVEETLGALREEDLARDYPLELAGARLSTGLFLAHLAAHLAYHLGQVDYHRRLVTGREEAVEGVGSMAALR